MPPVKVLVPVDHLIDLVDGIRQYLQDVSEAPRGLTVSRTADLPAYDDWVNLLASSSTSLGERVNKLLAKSGLPDMYTPEMVDLIEQLYVPSEAL